MAQKLDHQTDVNFLTVGNPTGGLGSPSKPTQPTVTSAGMSNQYDFTTKGESGYLGQDGDDYHATSDAQLQTLPDPSLPGASGTKNMGPQGDPLDWNSVAPYKYPEYPADSYTAHGGRARVQD